MVAPEPGVLPATVLDKYGNFTGVITVEGDVLLYIGSQVRYFSAAQRKDFMLAWMEAERQAEAHERGVIAAASVYPPGCGLPGCVSHYAAVQQDCLCPAWFDSGGHHIAEVSPACGAHQVKAVAGG